MSENAAAGIGIVFILIFLAIFIAIFVFYLLTLRKALVLAGPENRQMDPNLVWLNFVPLLNLGWIIYTVLKVSEAITNKLNAHDVQDPGQGAKAVGLTYGICGVVSIIPFIGMVAGLVGFVCWIIYWVKVAGYNSQMQTL